ncbi:MAG: heme o synthase [Chitinophagaceae bacterium]|nr:heme o synthase [Chitinophagaceae bacterium]
MNLVAEKPLEKKDRLDSSLAQNIKPSSGIKDYLMLMKPALSIMVVFSSVVSFMLTRGYEAYTDKLFRILMLFSGGLLVTGSANAINQILEKETDAVMKRTAGRPVASGRLTTTKAWIFALLTGITGILILFFCFNILTAFLAAFSLFLYVAIYTPLKKISSFAVLTGAVPGALPCLIGWTAGNNAIGPGGWVLFLFQFFWQLPHFWAIAWVVHKDYSTVGFRLLPSAQGPTRFTALQTIIFSVLLIPVSLAPFFLGICDMYDLKGSISIGIILFINLMILFRAIRLYFKMNIASARSVMFGSYIYLPVVMLSWLLAKA